MKAEIASHQARFTLERLHAEYGGKILENKKEAKRLAESMRHIEAVLKMLDPSYSVRSIAVRRRQHNPYFKRGTLFRHAIEALRTAERPLTATEITERMLAAKGVTDAPRDEMWNLYSGVKASLNNNTGKIVEAVGEGLPKRWRLKTG